MPRKIFISTIFFLLTNWAFSQQIIRSTIGSIGTSMGNGTITVQHTSGQLNAISFVQKSNMVRKSQRD
jgi:hypothetical protein